MTAVKGSTIAATLISGWSSDVAGVRITLLLSLVLAAIGLSFLPLHLGFVILMSSGVVAQLGITSINTTMRLLLTQTVERKNQKEALGWMRLVNNMGQVLSYGLATMTASLGALVLIWFDAATSLIAFFVGMKILPQPVSGISSDKHASSIDKGVDKGTDKRNRAWWPFIGCTLLLTGWNFAYEFFITGVAGRLKVFYPEQGLRIFSMMMVLNTVLCALLAVKATRVITRVVPSLMMGVVLTTTGLVLGVLGVQALPLVFGAILLLTLGEIIYGALMQFLLIRSVPPSRRENMVYSVAILIANFGRMIAAGLAFPMVVSAHNVAGAAWLSAGLGGVSLIILILGNKNFQNLD